MSSRLAASAARRRKLLIFVTEDWYFVSHRLSLAVAAQAAGYDVSIVTRVRDHAAVIRDSGLRLIPFENVRSSLNPLGELRTLARLVLLYRRERPDLVHHVAMKPVLYGSLAARLAGRPPAVNALAGMGWLFTSGTGGARWLKPAVRWALARALATGVALVQNPDDALFVKQLGVPGSRIRRVAGSGVDLKQFRPQPFPGGDDSAPVVVLPARLLWDKGVGEFVDAARLLRQRGVVARFVLAGEPDPLNPASIPPDRVSQWIQEGIVECVGWVSDMPALMAACHVVCLPSYREGLPKSLIEAAAAGKPIVTTDVPGCREAVRDGDNGLLVPPRNAQALADALARLIENPELRRQMGARGRIRAEQEFGMDKVIGQMLALYEEALA
ncbi:MAG TPA: glycosyltransferase family 4 protein [Vicinamibacterales bacterium]